MKTFVKKIWRKLTADEKIIPRDKYNKQQTCNGGGFRLGGP